jgi:hypothetical protein
MVGALRRSQGRNSEGRADSADHDAGAFVGGMDVFGLAGLSGQ